MSERISWETVIEQARAVVGSYGTPVTLRQVFYRLVAAGLIPNSVSAYKRLSALTAAARRDGTFPDLDDRTRSVHQLRSWTCPRHALTEAAGFYRRDRAEGQEVCLVLGVEKATLTAQVADWYSDYGWPVVTLRGYSSQTYADDVRALVVEDGRPGVLLYAGDLDPSGEDISRDFVDRTGCWTHVERIAVRPEHVERFNLPPLPGKATDSRARRFVERHGRLIQVEVEALDPDDLHDMFSAALANWHDDATWRDVLAAEREEREQLRALADHLENPDSRPETDLPEGQA